MSLLLPSLSATLGSSDSPNKPQYKSSGHAGPSQSSLLRDMLATPLVFGPPVQRSSFAPSTGLKEVLPGPPSPPRGLLRLDPQPQWQARSSGRQPDGAEEKPTPGGTGSPKKVNGKSKDEAGGGGVGAALPTPLTTPRRNGPSMFGPSSATVSPLHQTAVVASSSKVNGTAASPGKGTAAAGPSSSKTIHPLVPDSALAFPPHLAKLNRAAAGLVNPSMVCYANATLQVMMHTPPFIREIEAHDKDRCLLASRDKFCMACLMRHLLTEHWKRVRHLATDLHRALPQIKKGFNRNRQEDTHEFFRFACDALQNSALAGYPKDTPEKLKRTTWVHRIWGGRVRSRVVCTKCSKPSDTFDDFLDLSLDCGQNKRSIGAMLQGFIKEDKLEGDNKYHCESCKSKANATKSFRIAEAPPVLTLHLKRFSVNYNSWNGKARADKFNQHIAFDEYLDIAPFMVDHKADGHNTKYRLFGVTCHRGAELRFGHYTAYVRAPNDTWYEADDDSMSQVRLDAVMRDKTAYLLSYIRLAEGQEIPPRQANGQANGSVTTNGTDGKRKRENDDNDHGRPVKTLTKPAPRATPQSSPVKPIPPLFYSNLDRPDGSAPLALPILPKSFQTNGMNAQHDDDANEDAGPTTMSAFGAELKHPRPVSAESFYTKSPIQRRNHPGPDSPGGGGAGRRGKKRKNREKGAPQPFNVGRSNGVGHGQSGGGKGRHRGFGGKQPGVFNRMKA